MSITFRGGSGVDQVEFTNELSDVLTYPAGIQSGDYGQVGVSWYNDQGNKPTASGWTELLSVQISGGINQLTVLERTMVGTESGSLTIAFPGGSTNCYANAGLMVFAGTGLSKDGAAASQANASSTAATAPSRTAAGSNETLLCWFGASDTSTTAVGASGMTKGTDCQNNTSNACDGFYQSIAAAGATGTRTITLGTARLNAGISTLLKEGGSSAALAGTPAAVATAVGAATTQISAAGAGAGVTAVGGSLSTSILPAGAALGVTTAAGSLSTNIPLAGAVQVLATPTGAPQLVAQLTGAAIAQAAIAAAISTIIAATGGSASVATPVGQLLSGATLAGFAAAEARAWATANAYGAAAPEGTLGVERQTSGTTTEADGLLGAARPDFAGAVAAQVTPSGTLVSWGSVTLGWTAVINAVGYRIKIGTAPGVYTRSVDTGNVLIFAVGGLMPGVTYYWTVVALHVSGDEGDTATEGSGTPDLPGAPHNLSAAVIAAAVATASMSTTIKSAGAVVALATVAGALADAGIALAGQSSAQTTVTGLAGVGFNAAGQVPVVTTVSGALVAAGAALQGFAAGHATAGGSLSVIVSVGGNVLVNALAQAGLTSRIALEGGVVANAQATGLMGSASLVSGAALADAMAAGSLQTVTALSAQVLINAIVSGDMTAHLPIAGFAAASLSLAGSMTTRIAIADGVFSAATAVGFLTATDDISTYYGGGKHITRRHAEGWWERIDARIAQHRRKKRKRRRPSLTY